MQTQILSTSTLAGTDVVNASGQNLGDIKDFMIDPTTGRILYAVLDFGGFLGIGNKLFAVPVQAFDLDTQHERFVLEVSKERLEDAPGFDKSDWPTHADAAFLDNVYGYYNISRTTGERRQEPVLN